ncbi:MAG: UvrD-helicase domain-containing protein [Planctomycetes bacterium]|nr:UvrD-helicase domain-containing protein [Planctomycetota bacterium]
MSIVIEANAGTGKTFAIIESIEKDLIEKRIPLENILVTTFTIKAANELRRRLAAKLLEMRIKDPEMAIRGLKTLPYAHIGTIHSFCFRLLKQYPNESGLSPLLKIDTSDKIDSVIDNAIEQHKNEITRLISQTAFEPHDVWRILNELVEQNPDIALNKSETSAVQQLIPIDPEKLKKKYTGDINDKQLLSFHKRFGPYNKDLNNLANCNDNEIYKLLTILKPIQKEISAILRQKGFLTYSTLISYARDLLKKNKKVRTIEKNKFTKIYMDEFQDTDSLQYEIMLYLSEKRNMLSDNTSDIITEPDKLCVVGDWKQSIYGFRGANLQSFIKFKKILQVSEAAIKPLDNNYRSCRHLVHFTNEFARHNFPFTTIPSKPNDNNCSKSNCVELYSYVEKTKKEELLINESIFITNKIIELSKKSSFRNMAVLLRKTTKAHILIRELNNAGIPYCVEGTKFLYQVPEVMDLVNILHYTADPDVKSSLVGLLRSSYLPLNDMQVMEYIKKSEISDNTLNKYLKRFMDKISEIRDNLNFLTPPDLMLMLFQFLPIFDALSDLPDSETKIQYILSIYKQSFNHLNKSCRDYIQMLVDNCLKSYEEDSEVASDEQSDAVRILTIHKSKGLEFDNVIVSLSDFEGSNPRNMSELKIDWLEKKIGVKCSGIFNTNYYDLSTDDKEETKREIYVAMTRAKQKLLITHFATNDKLTRYIPDEYKTTAQINNNDLVRAKSVHTHSKIKPITIKTETIHGIKPTYDTANTILGEAAHYVLEHANFNNISRIDQHLTRYFKLNNPYFQTTYPDKLNELAETLTKFFSSHTFEWVKSLTLLAKEKTFHCFILNEPRTIRIDLLLREKKSIWILDYKLSASIAEKELAEYKKQLKQYSQVIKKVYRNKVIKTGVILLKSCKLIRL